MNSKFLQIVDVDSRTSRRIQLWIIASFILSAVLITYSPFEYLFKQLGYADSNGCVLLTLLNIPCPMCGIGRGFWAILKMDSEHMFWYNPLAPIILLISVLIIGIIFTLSIFKKTIRLKSSIVRLWYIPAALLIIVWILNILYGHH